MDNSGAHYSKRDVCNQECTSAGGMLTSVHSKAENYFLASLDTRWKNVGDILVREERDPESNL